MATINETFISALLADATYVNGLTQASDLADRLKERMTPTLAEYIDQRFDLVTQIETNEAVGSGFDATVWRRTDGKLFVSMRGTELGMDLANADVDLAFNGNARLQLIDMVNWWLRETGPAGQPVRQITVSLTLSPQPPLFLTTVFTEAASALGTGRIRSGAANLNSAISGNSGHDAGPTKAWREGVFDGQEVSASHPAHAQSGLQGAGRSGGPARGQDDGRVVQGVRAAPNADRRMEATVA